MKPREKRIGLFVHPWHSSGRDILWGIFEYCQSRTDWLPHAPWPGTSHWASLEGLSLDGLILRTGNEMPPPADFGDHLPRVVVGNAGEAQTRYDVVWDNEQIGREAADHLLVQGHRTFACVLHGSHEYEQQRARGFSARVQEEGLTVRQFEATEPWPKQGNTTKKGKKQPSQNKTKSLAAFVNHLARPTGVFACTDLVGRDLLSTMHDVALRCPEDLAVVGAGNDALFCELSATPLSSVSLPGRRMGYLAAGMLERLLAGESKPARPLRIAPHHVAVRRSSDILAIDDAPVMQAVRIIRDRAEPLSPHEVHKAVPLSKRALEVRFKKQLGRTIQQEIWRTCVERAKRLLSQTNMPMPDIAERAGFIDAQRLSVIFRRYAGESPTRFRQRLRQHR